MDARLAQGYARADAQLRRAASVRGALPIAPPALSTADDALTVTAEALPADPWFDQRWSLGEGEAMAAAAARLAGEASAFDHGGLLGPVPAQVIASPAVGPRPLASGTCHLVAAAPRATGAAVAVALIAADLAAEWTGAEALSPAAARLTSWHAAVTAVLMARGLEAPDEEMLAELAEASLPRPAEAAALEAAVRQIGADALDQAPGEIGRIAEGLAGRRLPRLARAWRRGFFVPRGFELLEWVAARRERQAATPDAGPVAAGPQACYGPAARNGGVTQ